MYVYIEEMHKTSNGHGHKRGYHDYYSYNVISAGQGYSSAVEHLPSIFKVLEYPEHRVKKKKKDFLKVQDKKRIIKSAPKK
jgi:hypothetical protein